MRLRSNTTRNALAVGLLLTFVPLSVQLSPQPNKTTVQHQQITVKIRNGKTGLPIWLASPYVFVGKTDPQAFMKSYRRTKLWGDAHVDVTGASPREIRVWIDFIHRDCRAPEGEQALSTFRYDGSTLSATAAFDLDTILSKGIVAPNLCGQKTKAPEPGVLTIFVIPESFTELWNS